MADNKKTKVDFATALREAADKIAPAKEKKPSKREESLIVDVSGTPTTLFRGDMTDEAWADLKAKADAKAIRPLPPKTYTAADQGTPEEFQNPFPDRAATAGDNGPGMSVLGNVAEMATNAAPAKPAPLSLEEGLSFGSQFVDNANKNIAAVPRALAGSSGVIVGNALEGAGQLVGSEGLQKRGAAMQGTGLDVLNPPPAPVEQPVGAGGMADMAPPPETAAAPSPPQSAIPGGFSPVEVDQALAETAKLQRDRAIADAQATKEVITAQGDTQQHLLDTAATTERRMQAEIALNAQLAAQAQLNSATEAKKFYTASTQLAQEARDAASTPTDPNRYWNNKDAGQKAMAVLAGALFGATGQGMNWLQRLDGLVENDMRAQQSDRASKVEGINTQARMLGEAGNRAMALGASEAQAHLIEKQAKLEGLKSYLDSMQMQVSGSEKKAQAAMMSQALSNKISELANEGLTLGELQAQRKNQVLYQNANLRQEAAKANATLGVSGGLGKLNPGESERLVSAQAAWDAIPGLEKAIGSGQFMDAAWDEFAKHFPGSSAANRDQQAQLLGRSIFAGIDKSVVNAADQEFLKKLQSGVGLRSMSRGDIPAFRRLVKASYNSVLKTAKARAGGTLAPLSEPTERPAE